MGFPIALTIGRRGISSLWISGKTYNREGLLSEGVSPFLGCFIPIDCSAEYFCATLHSYCAAQFISVLILLLQSVVSIITVALLLPARTTIMPLLVRNSFNASRSPFVRFE